MPKESDYEIMMRVKEGRIDDLGILFERHQSKLTGFFARMSGSLNVAEDLVQEVFVRMLRYRKSFRERALRTKISSRKSLWDSSRERCSVFLRSNVPCSFCVGFISGASARSRRLSGAPRVLHGFEPTVRSARSGGSTRGWRTR